ncbi:MAG TPA: hypothetical protein PLQ89_21795 [Phycisphaerae bacterium]|nr:hypothetical protein [Phycisphaerae bacterium]HOM50469.1 hypothetical protein [Phycisphaerae bacterium]HON66527.1 hypothetical protein [Phycisphaerae bacterium]HOQ88346.1 hypothetical protein [Phycisphaerae bacterium]HPP28170.1 hypothetical protein [Phycisphaerae bacterium]
MLIALFGSALMLGANPGDEGIAPSTGTLGRYVVLTCKTDTPPPFENVDIILGPQETVAGVTGDWWGLQVRSKSDDVDPLFEVQLLIARPGTLGQQNDSTILRYILRIPATGEALDYRNIHTGLALLPPWRNFQHDFLPRPVRSGGVEAGLPRTAMFLGHVSSLKEVVSGVEWQPIRAKQLDLDPELLVGTARPYKDVEGHRLPQQPKKQDYTYVRFTAEDYKQMIAAGSNIFMVEPQQEEFVRDQPVFFCRRPTGKAPLRWPADLYRSNYLGGQMFIDEPAIVAVGDDKINRQIRRMSDFLAVVGARVHEEYRSARFDMDKLVRDRKANLGALRIETTECPIWETLYETAFYQMEAGGTGFIQEGRYELKNFIKQVAEKSGVRRNYSNEEMYRYYYAVLRGGTRPFGKDWGMSIYGQCDPDSSPLAITMAYDMGARYIWFWTSDHEFHLPWNEQMELTRALSKHRAEKPRPSIAGPPPTRDLAIVLPYGSMASLESLWFIRELDPKRPGPAGSRYKAFLGRVFQGVNEALDNREDFDITVDDGREISGYRRIVRIEYEP